MALPRFAENTSCKQTGLDFRTEFSQLARTKRCFKTSRLGSPLSKILWKHIFSLYILYIYFIYTLYILYIYFIYTLYILYIYFIYTLYILYIYFIYTLYILYIYFIYILYSYRWLINKIKLKKSQMKCHFI